VRDGLRAVANAIEDQCVIPGAGAFEIHLNSRLVEFEGAVVGKAQLGYRAYAEAVLTIPKVLAQNSGFDIQEAILLLKQDYARNKVMVGLDLNELGLVSPEKEGIYDNYCVKRIFLSITTTLVEQLLLCDEIIRAGKQMGGD
jgi:T-complex protein 1 subunit zeta